jgi:hypothetical protein
VDAAVGLVQAYLHLNGYFTVTEFQVLEATWHDFRTKPCAGRDEADRDESPFAHVEDIASVTIDRDRFGRASNVEVGATAVFRALARQCALRTPSRSVDVSA